METIKRFIASLITPENKLILITRAKALVWTLGNYAAIAGLDFMATNLDLFNLPTWSIAIIGSVTQQITKQLNAKKL